MATYQVKGPDGKYHGFQGPEGLPANLVNLLAQDFFEPTEEVAPPPPAPVGESGFLPSVYRGGRGVASLLTDVLPAMAAKAVGQDEYATKKLVQAAAYQKETEQKYPAEVPSYTDITGVGSALTYLKEAVGEAIPSMIPSLLTGGAASIAARPAIKAAMTVATEVAEREVAKAAAKNILTQESLEGIKKFAIDAGAKEAQKIALTYDATGALVGSALQNIPDVYQNVYDKTGKQDLGTALAFGGFNAVLDAVTPFNILRKMRTSGIEPEQLIGAWYKRGALGALEGFATEGSTEALQEMSSVAAENLVAGHGEFFNRENFVRFVDAGLKGGLGGGVITGATNVAFGKGEPKAPEVVAPVTEEEAPPPVAGTTAPVAPLTPGEQDFEINAPGFVPAGTVTAALTPEQATLKTELDALKVENEARRVSLEKAPLPTEKGQAARLAKYVATIETIKQKEIQLAALPTTQPALEDVPELGVANATGLGSEVSGAGIPISGKPDTGVTTEGTPTPERSGVVSTGQDAPVIDTGKEQPASTVARENYWRPNPNAPEDANSWQDKTGFIHYEVNALLPNKTGRINKIIDQEQSGNIALIFKNSKNEEKILSIGFLNSGKPVWSAGASSEDTVKQNIGDELYNSIGNEPIKTHEQYVELVTRIRNAINNLPKEEKSSGTAPTPPVEVGTIKKAAFDILEAAPKVLTPAELQKQLLQPDTAAKWTTDKEPVLSLKETAGLINAIMPSLTPKAKAKAATVTPLARPSKAAINEDIAKYEKQIGTEYDKEYKEYSDKNGAYNLLQWGDLPRDAKDVFLNKVTENTPEERSKGFAVLTSYISKVREAQLETSEDKGLPAPAKLKADVVAGKYERNRHTYQYRDRLTYPSWDQLTTEQREIFENKLNEEAPKHKKSKEPMVSKANAEHEDTAFKAVSDHLVNEGYVAKPGVTYGEVREAQLKKQEAKRLTDIQKERAAEEPKSETEYSAKWEYKANEEYIPKFTDEELNEAAPNSAPIHDAKIKFLPDNIVTAIKSGNLQPLLDHLRIRTPIKVSDVVSKIVAQRMYELVKDVKIKFVDKLNKNHIAEYDAVSNTIFVTSSGLNEYTMQHELVHAATVKILDLYINRKGVGLTAEQKQAAEHIIKLMEHAKTKLGSKVYKEAFTNPFEFVAYALSNPPFQMELARMDGPHGMASLSPAGKPSAWSEFLRSVIDALGLKELVNLISWQKATGKTPTTNVLLEVAEAFNRIASAPEGNIEIAPLPATAAAASVTKQAPPKTPAYVTTAEALAQVAIKDKGAASSIKNLGTTRGLQWLATMFQNERYELKLAEDRGALFGILERLGDKLNNVYGQITRSSGIAVDLYETRLKFPTESVNHAVESYANKLGIPIKDALARLHLILEARHEPERRAVKYLRNVPLDDANKNYLRYGKDASGNPLYYSAAGFREAVLKALSQPMPKLSDAQRKQWAQTLRGMLDKVVADKNSHAIIDSKGNAIGADLFDINSVHYNVIADRPSADIARYTRDLDTKADKKEIDAVSDAIKAVHEITIDLNREANYWSQPVSNVVDFYGFKNYVPFKGRPEGKTIDEEFNIDSKRLGGEMQEGQDTFQGRMSESENPILQSLADGATAALRAGRKDLTLAVKNAVNKSARILHGKVIGKIKFEDRFLGSVNKAMLGGENKIFHYNQDGTIDIIELTDKKQKEALRRSYRESQPVMDIVNKITSGIGQGHTRYNPAFAPMNFVRDSLTNAFTIGAELGASRAGKLISGISQDVASGGLYRALNYSSLYANGKFDQIKTLAGGDKAYNSLTDKERYYRDLSDYVKMGGKVSYLQGVAARGKLEELVKEVGRSGILLKKDQIDKFIDVYNDMFELSSRVASYRLLKTEFEAENIKKGMAPAKARGDAQIQAVEYAKNLANFEQVGRWGKNAGALFMFFRPAATGAVRAIESLAPAFGFNEKNFRLEAKAQGISDAKVDAAVATMYERQHHARVMAGSLVGMGMAMYFMALMMSGDDEQGRNKVLNDDMSRWGKYARFSIPGTDVIIQIPWAFGIGTFAAAGAQLASLATGKQKIVDIFTNIGVMGLENFLPLPVSRINPVDNLPAAIFDSVTPSPLRPFFEYVMNLDGLGREIYNNRQSKYGDAYTGGDNIPEMYKQVARSLFNATDGKTDISPNTLYFFMSNYLDGFNKILGGATNLGLLASGAKDFDPKNDMVLLSSFIGSKSNVDAREFSEAEKQIKDMDKRINSLKDKPEMLSRYMESNPTDYYMVQYYNQQVNGSLKQLRTVAGQIRSSPDLPIRDRKLQIEQINQMQNVVKRQLLDSFEYIKKGAS